MDYDVCMVISGDHNGQNGFYSSLDEKSLLVFLEMKWLVIWKPSHCRHFLGQFKCHYIEQAAFEKGMHPKLPDYRELEGMAETAANQPDGGGRGGDNHGEGADHSRGGGSQGDRDHCGPDGDGGHEAGPGHYHYSPGWAVHLLDSRHHHSAGRDQHHQGGQTVPGYLKLKI